jgi:hypothetical protein
MGEEQFLLCNSPWSILQCNGCHNPCLFFFQANTYGNQLKEASLSLFEQNVAKNKLTLVGFPGPDQHYEVEEIFYEVCWQSGNSYHLKH